MPVLADPQAVREIDVIAVDLDPYRDWSQWSAVPRDVIGPWTNEQVEEVLDLVAALPAAEQMRCFVPSFAVRLRSRPTVLAEVAFVSAAITRWGFHPRTARRHRDGSPSTPTASRHRSCGVDSEHSALSTPLAECDRRHDRNAA